MPSFIKIMNFLKGLKLYTILVFQSATVLKQKL